MSDGTPHRVALFGGSFDPPHVGHTLVTAWAIAALPIDEVRWVPTWRHAFDKRLTAFEERLELCQIATAVFDERVVVDPIEATLGGESRTVDTIEAILEREPHIDISLLVGADIVPELPRWKRWSEIAARCGLFVVGRGGFSSGPGDIVLPEVSSTAIRRAVGEGDWGALEGHVDLRVLDRIRERGLYGA